MSRRAFLPLAAATLGVACATPFLGKQRKRQIPGAILGANSSLGHALRDGRLPAPSQVVDCGIVIVGGGISGLAAARQLKRLGITDFVLLELESCPGGNALSGRNAVSAYPWGAHYVPIAGSDAPEVTKLFEELGIIIGRDAAGLPIYQEEYLCSDPMERLYRHGRWQEGFVPLIGVSPRDRAQMEAFFQAMRGFQNRRGRDGRRAFTIPLDGSSRDEEFLRLDRMTMLEFLQQQGWWDCEPLRWYVDYCCRDDYGAGLDKVSAWAGIHYFASRDGRAANAAEYAVVTWPEGNGWLVEQLRKGLDENCRTSCAVFNVVPDREQALVDYFDTARGQSTRLRARGVVWAAPHFVARRAIPALSLEPAERGPVYSPWMVANITLDALPAGQGMDLAWDNVMYDSSSLGYVVATHQSLQPVVRQTVLTYYQPLDHAEPAQARQEALKLTHPEWCERILADLSRAHPDLSDHIQHLDIWVWGHAMVRPVREYIWGSLRSEMGQPLPNLVFAHTDLSGISIFEEAYIRGTRAANSLLEIMSRPPEPA